MRRSSFKPKFAHRLVEVQNARSIGERLKAFKGFSPAELAPLPPSTSEPRTGLSMGQHTELMAQEWKIAASEQDQLALESHKKAAEAYRTGYMDDLVVPFAGVFRDNNLREDISLEQDRHTQARVRQGARHADRRPTRRRSPTARPPCCWRPRNGRPSRGLPVQAYLTYSQTSAPTTSSRARGC